MLYQLSYGTSLIADAKVLLIFESANEKRKKMPNTPKFSVKSPLLGVVHGSIGAKIAPSDVIASCPLPASEGWGALLFCLFVQIFSCSMLQVNLVCLR
ncbi:MAG: hypothetical protein IKY72_06660 [Bacteroidaceae bacterium]|nr:hypothetical protein [Bacteroidaceae bacterium]